MRRLLFGLLIPSLGFSSTAGDAKSVLQKRCLSCHGQAQMSGLDLRQIETMKKGGTRGAGIVPGNAGQSLLYKAVARSGDLKMPPGKPLDPEEIEIIRKWIDDGASWDNAPVEESSWWAFRKVHRPAVPPVGAKNPVDSFVLYKLQQNKLRPVAPADKRTLVRRAYLDLHGLPPTPAEVVSFLRDNSPDAYEKLVDSLLASPRYGERWGRHWLDVVRYADTGGFETDMYYANAWRYRDYVIQSLNDDKPYNQFVQEQVAGDELWPDNLDLAGGFGIPEAKQKHLQARIGTGLYTIGPTYHEAALNGEQLQYEWLSDVVDTTGQAFMGLTVGCARCHDHKFDPISQRDYHRMMALFAGSEEREVPVVDKMSIFGFKAGYTNLLRVQEYKSALQRLDEKVHKRAVDEIKAKFPPGAVAAYVAAPEKRTPKQVELAGVIGRAITEAGLTENASGKVYTPNYTAAEKDERERLVHELGKAAEKASFNYPTATVLGHSDVVPEVHMTSRGDFHGTGPKVGPGFPKFLGGINDLEESTGPGFVPQRRRALALWLTQPENPLTARVMVNRIWAGHFGRGIVGTPGDFGKQGEPPANQELLDWLASEFVQQGWSMKKMHRLIMTSAAYQMSSAFDAENAKIDPNNRYLWRMNRRRMDAEQLRDSVLSVSGSLNLKMGGRAVIPPLTDEEKSGMWAQSQWPVALDPSEHTRRSVYLHVKRSFPYPMLAIFDEPESSVSCPRRDVTTVAPQALALINSKFMLSQARELARRVEKEHPNDPRAWVQGAWDLTLSRKPSESDIADALRFLSPDADQPQAMARFCLVLLNMNEFLYID